MKNIEVLKGFIYGGGFCGFITSIIIMLVIQPQLDRINSTMRDFQSRMVELETSSIKEVIQREVVEDLWGNKMIPVDSHYDDNFVMVGKRGESKYKVKFTDLVWEIRNDSWIKGIVFVSYYNDEQVSNLIQKFKDHDIVVFTNPIQ